MNGTFKKLTSLFAAVAMVITAAAVPVFADTDAFIQFIKDNTIQTGNTFTLKNDITLSQGIPIKQAVLTAEGIEGAITIDLGNHTVTINSDVNAIHNYDADVTVQNGTIDMEDVNNEKAYVLYNSGKMTVKDLTINSKRGALYNFGSGNMTVNSGTYRATEYHALYNDYSDKNYNPTVTINGGTFDSVYNAVGTVTINDGTFDTSLHSNGNVEVAGENGWVHTENFIYVNGGKFKNDPAKVNNVRIKDSRLTELKDGYYELGNVPENIAKDTVGGTTYYKTLEEIANTYVDVTLLKDIVLTENFIMHNSNNLNLDGHNITSTNGSKIIRKDGGHIRNDNPEITSTVDVEIEYNPTTNTEFYGNIIFNKPIKVQEVQDGWPPETTATFNAEIVGPFTANVGAKFNKNIFKDPKSINVNEYSYAVIVDTNDGYYTCVKASVKNSTQNKCYASIADAIADADSGDTIQLLAEITDTVVIPADKNIILDTCNKNITNDIAIENNGTLVIKNSYSSTSTISGKINNNGKLTIQANSRYSKATPKFTDEIKPEWCESGYFPFYDAEAKLYSVETISIYTGKTPYTAVGTDGSQATGFTTRVNSKASFSIKNISWSVTSDGTTKSTPDTAVANVETTSIRIGIIINGINNTSARAKATVTTSDDVVLAEK